MLGSIKEVAGRVASAHPYSWKIAWEAVHRLAFLLPHDPSYKAFRHFTKNSNGLFLDVGANDGISALSFRRLNKTYEIISLEPNLLLESALKKVKKRDRKFNYKMVGAGAEVFRTAFFVPVYRGVVLHTFTSASCEQVVKALTSAFGEAVAAQAKIHEVDGDIIPIDHLNLDPSIIKIDAEGFDYEVLVGARKTIERMRPFIAVEVAWSNVDKMQAYFTELDYVLLSYEPKKDEFSASLQSLTSAKSGYRNLFAIPKEKSSVLAFSHQ